MYLRVRASLIVLAFIILNKGLVLAGGESNPPAESAGERGAPAIATETPSTPPSGGERLINTPYVHFQTGDRFARTIDYYLTLKPREAVAPLPLIVYVQGSGCGSHFARINGQIAGTTGHNLIYDAANGRARLLIVEKPGVRPFDRPNNPGSSEEASDEFKREHTLERWCAAIHAAVDAVAALPEIDASRILVIGHSEGGLVACRLAADDPRITHVACLAGGGPTQLYDFLDMARNGHFFDHAGATADERVKYVLESWKEVLADPDAADKLWLGHPYRRWSSFCATSPIEQLLKGHAAVYIAQGSADQAVSPATAIMLQASLLGRGRSVHLNWVEGGDHGLARPEDQGRPNGWAAVMKDAVDWYLTRAEHGGSPPARSDSHI